MQIATVRLKLNDSCDVPVRNVTPPEAMILMQIHAENAGGTAIKQVTITGDSQISLVAEKKRLSESYNTDVVEKLFPGAIPRMPMNFLEIESMAGITTEEILDPVPLPEPEKKPRRFRSRSFNPIDLPDPVTTAEG